MSYALEEIARTLKAARLAKGLSQRGLSTKVGLTQAHLSKVENGGVDIKLSNLIELARGLDLEVTLVPAKTVSAVRSIVRNVQQRPLAKDALRAIRSLQDISKHLSTILHDAREVQHIQSVAREMENLPLNAAEIAQLQKAAKEAQGIYKSIQPMTIQKLPIPNEELKRIGDLARELQGMRNAIAHALPPNIERAHPAYRLDEDDANG